MYKKSEQKQKADGIGTPVSNNSIPDAVEPKALKPMSLTEVVDSIVSGFNALPEDRQLAVLELAGNKPGAAILKLTTGFDLSSLTQADPSILAMTLLGKVTSAMNLPPAVGGFLGAQLSANQDKINALFQGLIRALNEEGKNG